MLVPENDKRELEVTEKQQTFLDALFGEAQGDPKIAGEIAGYADYHQPLKSLKDEIIDRAEKLLAAFAPRATMGMVNALQEDGSTPGASIRMEAAKQILDRVGLSKGFTTCNSLLNSGKEESSKASQLPSKNCFLCTSGKDANIA
jgi:hypothetical protein